MLHFRLVYRQAQEIWNPMIEPQKSIGICFGSKAMAGIQATYVTYVTCGEMSQPCFDGLFRTHVWFKPCKTNMSMNR